MAKGHSYFWRKPGRPDEERKKFAALMRKVEAVRVREGMTKTELAAELGANVDGVRAWMTGRTVGRKETVAKLKEFLKRSLPSAMSNTSSSTGLLS
jgi:ribosome-binding protein aMBF1 (putative translation factor)